MPSVASSLAMTPLKARRSLGSELTPFHLGEHQVGFHAFQGESDAARAIDAAIADLHLVSEQAGNALYGPLLEGKSVLAYQSCGIIQLQRNAVMITTRVASKLLANLDPVRKKRYRCRRIGG